MNSELDPSLKSGLYSAEELIAVEETVILPLPGHVAEICEPDFEAMLEKIGAEQQTDTEWAIANGFPIHDDNY